ncbi:MAG: hypothetical protein CMJ65_11600 [Planctomycetaceae bacterium]|jgi:dienelactone hydrolase|nr:hypothetical protein [Planctomycetaceae bacterium]
MIRSFPYLLLFWLLLDGSLTRAAQPRLPGTGPLTVKRSLAESMVEGINRFCLRELSESSTRRRKLWARNFPGTPAATESLGELRERFRRAIGAVDPRVTRKVAGKSSRHEFELLASLEHPSLIARTQQVTVQVVRWPVLEGVTAEGLLLTPRKIRAAVVALPDADWTPEMFCGVQPGLPEQVQLARRLAAAGCLVAIPTLINRDDEFSGSRFVAFTNQPHREFIYRQAFEMGRHVIGYEVQKVLAAVDLFEQLADRRKIKLPIGVAGVGEGGLLALHAAALDPRLRSALVCGYFQDRENLWKEPIYRNVWGLLAEFGDAELAGLVAPRRLVIESCRVPTIDGPPAPRPGRREVAAPGRIEHNTPALVESEFRRARLLYARRSAAEQVVLVSTDRVDRSAGSAVAVESFVRGLGIEERFNKPPPAWQRLSSGDRADKTPFRDSRLRQQRQFHELQVHVQTLLRLGPKIRDLRWKADLTSVATWLETGERLRDRVYDELIGRLPNAGIAANPRSRLVLDRKRYRGYEVVLDVLPDVIASGVLLLPKDLKPGERRPVVVCQHGLEGLAMDTISRKPRAFRFYKAFAEELCLRGFIVYSPQNPYYGRDRFRTIQRKSNPLGRSLYSYIIRQHQQTLEWLATLPQVDPARIAFYGLSYGGKTAMRVPPFVKRYCLSICSGDFTKWVKSIAGNEDRYNYIFTSEYEIPEWNMGHVAGYAELAMLMTPRPFMVEQGHRDGGAPTEWVAGEFGKVRRHYDLLKLGSRIEIEFFNGPHTINGKGTFVFLHRHLDWPLPGS